VNKIEGGPECPECNGDGKERNWYPKENATGQTYFIPVITGNPCPKCDGTGIAPLSEWTADECADYILKAFRAAEDDEQIAGYCYPDELIADYFLDWANGKYETFTVALTAAVECVAKEKE